MVEDTSGSSLICYLGRAASLVIAESVETIDDGCFLTNVRKESQHFVESQLM
jgi:hypothetical protein